MRMPSAFFVLNFSSTLCCSNRSHALVLTAITLSSSSLLDISIMGSVTSSPTLLAISSRIAFLSSESSPLQMSAWEKIVEIVMWFVSSF